MSEFEGMQEKFLVLKVDDIKGYATKSQKRELTGLMNRIEWMRKSAGKSVGNKYLVINTDEPYAPEVVDIMKRHGHWG
ncbi:hypothetical protein [Desulfitobacterium hafniense]|uniref:hypothetical protein n=1 Tax=Desulfitobacterium hafniense TaxID=49338 RepID=UPI0003724A3E|nr:hypothetical protein [Desulfitobacterium hafniense]